MDTPLIGVGGFLVALGLIFLRVPVAVAMGLVGVVGFAIVNGFFGVAFVMGAAPFEAVFPYGLSVVPLFVLMGVVTAHSGLSRSLYKAVNAFVGHYRGGLAMATVGACAGFGAVSGSSLATVATMCRVSLPEMRRHGYDDRLAAGSIAAGGTLGVLIPPSILLVLYGILTELSIGRLFLAALLPGALATLLYMAAVAIQTRLNPALGPAAERMSWSERLRAIKDVWGIALLFALVLGGIYLGWFSPTEAAAVGAFGAFAIALLQRQLSLSVFRLCLTETAGTTGMIFFILIGATVFNYFIETTNLPQMLVSAAQDAGTEPLCGAGADHAVLPGAGLFHGQPVHDPADGAVRVPAGAGHGLQRHMVRHPFGDGRRTWADHTARGHEPVRASGRGARAAHADGRAGRGAVPGG